MPVDGNELQARDVVQMVAKEVLQWDKEQMHAGEDTVAKAYFQGEQEQRGKCLGDW